MKRFLILMLALSILFVAAACTDKNNNNVNVAVNDIAQKILDELELDEHMMEMPDEMSLDAYPFDRDLVSEYVIYQAIFSTSADEFAIFKVKNQSDIETIKDAIESRIDQVSKVWETYMPGQYEKVKNKLVITNGNYVFVSVLEDQDKVEDIFKSFME